MGNNFCSSSSVILSISYNINFCTIWDDTNEEFNLAYIRSFDTVEIPAFIENLGNSYTHGSDCVHNNSSTVHGGCNYS